MRRHFITSTLVAVFVALPGIARAQAPAQSTTKQEKKLGWANNADFSLVVTAGNSASQTLGLSDNLKHVWLNARFTFDLTSVWSHTSDDRYFLLEPGLVFPVGAQPPASASVSFIKPEPAPDVATFLAAGRYDRNITAKFFWNAGASWDHNRDAGIDRRYILFAGLGNTWSDNQRRLFTTTYSLSYTDRKEQEPDPEKEPKFAGARLGWDYTEHISAVTTFDSIFTSNIRLSDAGDFSINTTNSVSVSMNKALSLKVSLQWLYENQPALETDLDVIAFVELLNPDGIPGSGDESFRTLASGGTKVVFGTNDARRDKLDTIFRTALVVKF